MSLSSFSTTTETTENEQAVPQRQREKGKVSFHTHPLSGVGANQDRGDRALLCKDPGLLCNTLSVLSSCEGCLSVTVYKCQLLLEVCCVCGFLEVHPTYTPGVKCGLGLTFSHIQSWPLVVQPMGISQQP